ncbi:hypothetical protein [Chitinophaga varians]|uniref:hypothetical protein n=1 Tax=Chitinophaga varians TaxID=2202339 RepID=UPI00165F5E6C|nr:hypothetical protein [Chitinophaga varians]MBC9909073.1 hypothetical protein [Chitinophaga varians]
MENVWDILTYLIDGCAISLLLFLIVSVYIPSLKNIRPAYLRVANITFAIIGLVPLGILVYLYTILVSETNGHLLFYWAKFVLVGLLLLGIVPILAFSRKRNTRVWFTCLLVVSIWAITHANAITDWTGLFVREGRFWSFKSEEPIIKWYRLAIALVFFLFCHWLTRRSIHRASQP